METDLGKVCTFEDSARRRFLKSLGLVGAAVAIAKLLSASDVGPDSGLHVCSSEAGGDASPMRPVRRQCD